MSRIKSLERAAKQAARERQKSIWMLVGIVLLMIGGVVADIYFIRWQRNQRQQQSLAKRPASTNQPASGVPATSSSVPMTH
jgi:uncharacterized membrane protein YidH (DUF202 family)